MTNLMRIYKDLSQVFGSDDEFSRKIRTYEYNLLKSSYNKYSKREQLPYTERRALV
jgi:hypothetical protein